MVSFPGWKTPKPQGVAINDGKEAGLSGLWGQGFMDGNPGLGGGLLQNLRAP